MKAEMLKRFFKPLIIAMLVIPAAYSIKVHLDKFSLIEPSDNNPDTGFSRTNLVEKSVEQLQATAENSPGCLAYIELGKKYEDQGQTDQAITAFKKAVELNDSSSYAHYYLGKLLNEKEFYPEALQHCNKALTLLPGFELAEYEKDISTHGIEGTENWK